MKAMPLLPFEEFQGKGLLDLSSSASSDSFSLLLHNQSQTWTNNTNKEDYCYVGIEPTSVLDTRRSPSPPTSSSTMSSSHGSNNSSGKGSGGGGSTNKTTTGLAPTVSENPSQAPLETCTEKLEEWEGQDQSIMRFIMGDIEDPSAGLSKILQSTSGCGSQNVDFDGNFGVLDQEGLELEPFTTSRNMQQQVIGVADEKPQVVNPQFLLNQKQVQFSENPSFFMPLTYPQMQEHHVFSQPMAKSSFPDSTGKHSYQVPKSPLLESGQELFAKRHQMHLPPSLPHHLQQRQQPLLLPSSKQQKVISGSGSDDFAIHQLQQSIFDQLFKAAELIEAGNPILAQGILARLNHQLSPIGKPFQRAAFYMKEALQFLLHSNTQNFMSFSPISFIFKIGAYKSFSEISPVLQFANFSCNQVLIESVERFDQIHIIDFDIGFGVQWSSFMQELALRNSGGGAPSLRITAIVSPSTCEEVELNFTRENLNQYAKELNMSFELNVMSIESLNSASSCTLPGLFSDNGAIAVNLPLFCFTSHPSSLPSVLRFLKQLMPKVVVTLDRNCDRIDVPFPNNVIHALQCYSALLESLDAVNVNLDVLQKIERHFLQPAIKKIILGHHHSREKLPPWRNMFLQCGFSPFTFSNFTEAQAECLVQRAPVRGFQVERKHSSLVLCWQQKELISVSTWRS